MRWSNEILLFLSFVVYGADTLQVHRRLIDGRDLKFTPNNKVAQWSMKASGSATAGKSVTIAGSPMVGKSVTIVTTSSLPWMTGTSVNPLLRAVQLACEGMNVTLMLPWLDPHEDGQDELYRGLIFSKPEEQEYWLRDWVSEHCKGFESDDSLSFAWYPARYVPALGSIIADQRKGDILQYLPPGARDLAILEEPEHLNWYHHGGRWSEYFQHVAGVVHTNYIQYSAMEQGGWLKAPTTKFFSSLAFAAHCDVIVQLSATLKDSGAPGDLSKVCNVHGVRDDFIAIGRRQRDKQSSSGPVNGPVYFLGKKLWAKGYRELLDFLKSPEGLAADMPPFHLYGSGPDEEAINQEIASAGLNAASFPATDHANEVLDGYAVLVNPSTSDVLCTVTAEALAMGKTVIIARHPSNEFFYQFTNCRTFSNAAELAHEVQEAIVYPPEPISDEELHLLSWEAATQRLVNSIIPDEAEGRATDGIRSRLYHAIHFTLSGGTLGDLLRVATGAPPDQTNSLLMNPQVMQYMNDIQPLMDDLLEEVACNMPNMTNLERVLSLDVETLRRVLRARLTRSMTSVQTVAAASTIAAVFPLVGLLGVMPSAGPPVQTNLVASLTSRQQGRQTSLPAPGRLLATLETLKQTQGAEFPLTDRFRLELDKFESTTLMERRRAYFPSRLQAVPKFPLKDLRSKVPARLPSRWSLPDGIEDA